MRRRLLSFWKATPEFEIRELWWPHRLLWWSQEQVMRNTTIAPQDKNLINDNQDTGVVLPG